MFRNYLTVGFRALAKNRTYAFINIFGLAIGLAACLILLLYVRYERSYDTWLPNADRAFQVQTIFTDPDTGEKFSQQYNAAAVGEFLKKDFPQIEHIARVLPSQGVLLRDGAATSVSMWVTDSSLFQVLELPFLEGDPATALKEGRSLVLSEEEAVRLFGKTNVLGETLTISRNGTTVDWRVTGVLKKIPANTHTALANLDMAARFDAADFASNEEMFTNWNWVSAFIYGKLRPGTSVGDINSQMAGWEKRNAPVSTVNGVTRSAGQNQDWQLAYVPDIHLGDAGDENDPRTLATFSIIALLILAMACVNFINLATARAGARAREVALRKVLGASRRQLIAQFLTESVLLTLVAMLLALSIAEVALPSLNQFLETEMELQYLGQEGILGFIAALVVVVGATGGLYPAFYLTRFKPAQTLKANRSSTDTSGSGRLRNILVVAQFAISIGLIICTAIVYSQTVFARTFDPGYRRDGLLQLEMTGGDEVNEIGQRLLSAIQKVDGVRSAALTSIGINTGTTMNTNISVPGKPEPFTIGTYVVSPDFFDTMEMKLLAGRKLGTVQAKDDATTPLEMTDAEANIFAERGMNVVINESAAKVMGLGRPGEAIGKQLTTQWLGAEAPPLPLTVVGVVADASFRTARTDTGPIVYRYDRTGGAYYIVVRYDDPRPVAVRNRIEGVWKEVASTMPFAAEFAEDRVAEIYEADEQRGTIFAGFAVLAVIIACLGLFGLASFTAERRTKEIGIRKVLGARARDIVRLLTWQFSKPVLVANIIAWPAAWWLMRDWLNEFSARIDLTPAPFVTAGLIALVIAICTIAGHALKVARSNPINALRYE